MSVQPVIVLPPGPSADYKGSAKTAAALSEFFTESGRERNRCRYGAPGDGPNSGCAKGFKRVWSKKTGRFCCVHAERAAAAKKGKAKPKKAAASKAKPKPKKGTRKSASAARAKKIRALGHAYF